MEIPKPKPPVKPLAEAPKKKVSVKRSKPTKKVVERKPKAPVLQEHLMQKPFQSEALMNLKNSLMGEN